MLLLETIVVEKFSSAAAEISKRLTEKNSSHCSILKIYNWISYASKLLNKLLEYVEKTPFLHCTIPEIIENYHNWYVTPS